MHVTPDILLTGAIVGLGYGMLAVGLLLTYRVARVLNFAYAQVGALAAAVMAKLILDAGFPYWAGLLVGVAAGAVLSFAFDRSLLRQLAGRPQVVLLVATLGLSQFAVAAGNLMPSVHTPGPFPSAFSGRYSVLGATITGADLTMLVTLLVLGIGLSLFLSHSRIGLALLACSDNADAARMAGVPVAQLRSWVFAAAGGLAALTVILYSPVQGLSPGTGQSGQGTAILLMAFTAALAGGFWSLPRAAMAGVLLGVVEALLYANTSAPGEVSAGLFVVLILVVLVTARRSRLAVESTSIAPATPPVPRRLEASRWARPLTTVTLIGVLAIGLILPVVFRSSASNFTLIQIICYALVALSVCVVTGWTGQITLGQFAFAGIGAFLTVRLMNDGWNMFLSLAVSALVGAILSAALGVPALRARGMFLAVLTLGFAVAVPAWLLPGAFLNPEHQTLVGAVAPTIGGYDLGDPRNFYYVCLAVLGIVLVLLAGIMRTGAGRQLRAVRDNETAAGTLGINAAAAKIRAFTLAGAIATLAGGLYGISLGVFQANQFSADVSISIFFLVVLGGIATLYGPVLAAVGIIGVPVILGTYISALSDDVQNVTTLLGAVGVVFALRAAPEGVGVGVRRFRERILCRLARDDEPHRSRKSVEKRSFGGAVGDPSSHPSLSINDVCVRFGGVVANDHVTFILEGNSKVGLIGANGAGKSTLVNAITGLQRCTGTVALGDLDLTRMPAHRRARAGIGRTFQDARLYDGLTVNETLATAVDTKRSTSLIGSMLWSPWTARANRDSRSQADDLVRAYGLDAWTDSLVSSLSTGTRRIVEIACVAARRPAVILFDEPAAGVAQREVEQLGTLLSELQASTGAAVLLIEHDLPFVMGVCERILALHQGRVIADGSPMQVRQDPLVIASYLGLDDRSIDRSSALTPSTPGGSVEGLADE